ncbi:hypothetical protein WA026_004213 [Henosepilachna vigintioctopunctata]|uniref:Uncharacterized protein n=1 Tax=Henosepilachna vigintioctopunctata TaxID=420089 RepID=A0AAW1UGU3_9CUCU
MAEISRNTEKIGGFAPLVRLTHAFDQLFNISGEELVGDFEIHCQVHERSSVLRDNCNYKNIVNNPCLILYEYSTTLLKLH